MKHQEVQEQKVKSATSKFFKQERVYWFTSIPPKIREKIMSTLRIKELGEENAKFSSKFIEKEKRLDHVIEDERDINKDLNEVHINEFDKEKDIEN